MLISNGAPVLTQGTLADSSPTFASSSYYPTSGLPLLGAWAAYGELYRRQLWVGVVIRKLAWGTARLPFDLKRQLELNNQVSEPGFLTDLLRTPNERLSYFMLWLWTSATFDTFGEAHWLKLRDTSGRVRELHPIHPTNLVYRRDEWTGQPFWDYTVGARAAVGMISWPVDDVVSFLTYNPDSLARGVSNLEGLRQTLLTEDAARRASTSFWQRGARPSVALQHPMTISKEAQDRILATWEANHAGADLMGGTAILEEGMTAQIIQLNAEEMQYIESRKLNREEVCAAYDVSPLAVHILDRATYSNVTEQLRSQYRDTMAPRLEFFESVVNHQLVRDFYPDPAEQIFGRFNMNEVLRGSFEDRATATGVLITNGVASPAELRPMFDLSKSADPAADLLYGNAALVPLGSSVHGQTEVDPNTGEIIPSPLPVGTPKPPPPAAPAKAATKAVGDFSHSGMIAVYPTAEQAAAIALDDGMAADTLHVTLAFLGDDPDEATLTAAGTVAASLAAQHAPLTGSVGGRGEFPAGDLGVPHYAPVDVPGLTELQTLLSAQLAAAGVDLPSEHGFTPHMTRTYADVDAAAPDPLEPVTVTFGGLVLVVGDEPVGTYPFSPPQKRAENVRSTFNTRAIARRLGRVKAAGGDVRAALVDEHEKAIAAILSDQADAITADPKVDLAGWNDELAQLLTDLGLVASKAFGETVAKKLGGTFDPDRIAEWITTDAADAAAALNATAGADLESAIAGRPDGTEVTAAAATFAAGLVGRATSIANSRVTRIGGLSGQVAAEQSGAATKTWVAGPKPRASHSRMDGETVELGEVFSNGMNGPGDPAGGADEVAGCDCSLDFEMP